MIYFNSDKLGNWTFASKEDVSKQNEFNLENNNNKLTVNEKHSNSDFEKKKGNQFLFYGFENDSGSNDNKTKKLEEKEINFLLNDFTIKSRGLKKK